MARLIAWDTETHLILPGLAVPKLVVGSFATEDGKNWLLPPDETCRFLEQSIDAGDILVAHNAAFDLSVCAEYSPQLLPKIFDALNRDQIRDTKLRQGLIDIEVGRRKNPVNGKREVLRNGEWVRVDYSLAGNSNIEGSTGLVGLYFGKDRSSQKGEDSWRLRYSELDGLPLELWPEEASKYALEDAVDTLDVYLAQAAARGVAPLDSLVDEPPQCRKAFALRLVSAWGLRVDAATLDELERRCLKVRDEIRIKLMSPGVLGCDVCATGEPCKTHGLFRYEGPKRDPKRKIVKNTKAIQARIVAAFADLGLPYPVTDKGAPKTDRDALVMSCDPLLEELAEAGPVSTTLQTFIPALRQGVEVPINTTFDELLDTGRISSSKPNLNNLARGDALQALVQMDVRQAVYAPEGFYICSVDYSQAELRSHAEVNYTLFGESAMGDLFNKDPEADPYVAFAATILGISYEEAMAKKKTDPEVKRLRGLGKVAVLSLPGGCGPQKLLEIARKQYGIKMTLAEARQHRENWKRAFPEMRKYLDYISSRTANGYFTLEQLVSGRKRGMCGYSDGANSYFQGLTADGAADALYAVCEEMYLDKGTPLYGSRPFGFAYDEILALVPIELAHEAAFRLSEVMIERMARKVKRVPIVAHPALMKRWTKAAEPKFDENGRLIPWDLTT